MQSSNTIKSLAAALVLVQREIEHAHKNAVNPHFKNRYADLTEVLDTVRPVLAKHGLSVVQFPGYADGVTTVETILTHESGEWMSGTAGARVQKDDPQGVGSAITYLRRYSLAAVCAIGQDDDDAEAAVAPRREQHQPAQRQATAPSSTPVGANGSHMGPFSLDDVAKGKKANGRTWRELLTTDDGRGFVDWAMKNMAILDFAAKEQLSLALAAAKLGDPDFTDELGVTLPDNFVR